MPTKSAKELRADMQAEFDRKHRTTGNPSVRRDKDPAEKVSQITPITRARQVLMGRCTVKDGSYYVDGYPVTVFKLIELANADLQRVGIPEVIKLQREAGL